MSYRVEFADQAKSDLFEIYLWIAEDSAVNASRWIVTLEAEIHGLGVSPERCVIAPENGEIEESEVRQLLVGRYRVLFIVRERKVFVLHIRHGSRRTATREELAGALLEGQRPDTA